MAFAYGTKHLGAGSIGGQGFWLCKEARRYYSGLAGLNGNTNLNLSRPLSEALTFNEKLPFIENQSLLEFLYYTDYELNWYKDFPFGSIDVGIGEPTWVNCGTFGGKNLYGYAPWYRKLSLYQQQRHAHRVLSDNRQGSFIESATRIPLGTSGYTDTLPGLFSIEPVAGTIISGDYCYVTIKPLSNPRVWWQTGSSRVHWDFEADYGTLFHPYLRGASEMVRVSLATGNHNKNVIPGVDIQFNTPLEGDQGIVSIGYEYVNAYSETGTMGEITGAKDYFMPLSARALQPWSYQQGGQFRNENWAMPSSLGWPYGLYGGAPPSRWHIYNVTGAEQEGCEFSIRPLVRLDQGNNLHPFDQWFMGPNTTASLTPQSAAFPVSFTNYQTGSGGNPDTVTIVFPAASTYIVEINPTTFQPTGVIHSDGAGLKCDGQTLYRWDALGIYFVLSGDLVAADTASIYVKQGQHIEKYFQMTNMASDWPNYDFTSAPFSQTIGGWNAIYDAGTGLYYPASYGMPETIRTGIMQTQGHDFEFSNVDVDSLYSHWYNHQFCVATYLMPGTDPGDNLNEYVSMVTCDDPKYFQVVPCTWNFVNDKLNGAIVRIEGALNTSVISKCSANISVRDPNYSVKCSGNIHERQGGLVLRVNQLSQELVDLMTGAGITLE